MAEKQTPERPTRPATDEEILALEGETGMTVGRRSYLASIGVKIPVGRKPSGSESS